jgi:hypothetical protein
VVPSYGSPPELAPVYLAARCLRRSCSAEGSTLLSPPPSSGVDLGTNGLEQRKARLFRWIKVSLAEQVTGTTGVATF